MPEREVKLAAPPAFRLPGLDGVAGLAADPRQPERLTTTYFDTDDLRLAAWGVSFRYRGGQGWTVKLPLGEAEGVLVRDEHTFPGRAARPPAAAADLVRAFVRGAELRPQVRLRTLRRGVALRDERGQPALDVVDDEVSVLEGRRIAARFRELEVEATGEDALPALEEVVARLRRAGAGRPDPTSKFIRALGPRAARGPEVEVGQLASGASAGDAVRRAIAASVVRLVTHDPVVRLDADPEGVHQARVATRRLRSDLRTFGPLLEPAWTRALRDELGWLAGLLGAVRDGDVLLPRLREHATRLAEPAARDAARVVAALAAERDAAYEQLLEALRGERYLALLDRLVAASREPPLLAGAEAPAAEALPALVARPWRALARSVEAVSSPPADEELHAIRIRTKRVRYAAEAIEPVVGKPARRFAAAAAGLQDALGELNDAALAEEWLRERARRSRSSRLAFAAGQLAGLERAAALEARGRWRKPWQRLSARSPRAWF